MPMVAAMMRVQLDRWRALAGSPSTALGARFRSGDPWTGEVSDVLEFQAMGRRIDKFGAVDQSGRLSEPSRVPEVDFAAHLVARTPPRRRKRRMMVG